MRRLRRPALSAHATSVLDNRTRLVQRAADPKKKAEDLWDDKQNAAFDEIRDALYQMASGRSRCMYCEDSQGTDIDHFWPKGQYPNGAFVWENYLLACSWCNSNQKRTQFPLSLPANTPLLLNPADPLDDPRDHLTLLPITGEFEAVDPLGQPSIRGDATIQVFGLNDAKPPRKLPQGRLHTLRNLRRIIKDYDEQLAKGTPEGQQEAKLCRESLVMEPFSSVLVWLLRADDAALGLLFPELPPLLRRHQIRGWPELQ